MSSLAQVIFNSYLRHHLKEGLGKYDNKEIIDELERGLETAQKLGHAEGYVEGHRDTLDNVATETKKLERSLEDLTQSVERLQAIVSQKNTEIFELHKK